MSQFLRSLVCQLKNLENLEFHEISFKIFGNFGGQKFYYESCHYIKMTIRL